jgi:hypothetical protein
MKPISVKEAKYLDDFKIEIFFNDNKSRVVDFGTFLSSHSHPQFNKYKQPEFFKKFQIENGNIVWGKNWDMIFPVYDLYSGEIK